MFLPAQNAFQFVSILSIWTLDSFTKLKASFQDVPQRAGQKLTRHKPPFVWEYHKLISIRADWQKMEPDYYNTNQFYSQPSVLYSSHQLIEFLKTSLLFLIAWSIFPPSFSTFWTPRGQLFVESFLLAQTDHYFLAKNWWSISEEFTMFDHIMVPNTQVEARSTDETVVRIGTALP